MEPTRQNKIRVAVLDDNLGIVDVMENYFSKHDRIQLVGSAGNGVEGLEMIRRSQPDVVLLDLVMPQKDGIGVLETIKEEAWERRPEFIVTSALSGDDWIRRSMELGVSYYIIKPFDMDLLTRRILNVVHAPSQASGQAVINTTRSLDERITTIFLTIGIPAHIKGYHFLRQAVKMVYADEDMINRITKELYPGVAKHFNTSATKVERAIRHAIEVAWTRGKIENINQVFGCNIYTQNDKPTNGEFIALMADKLLMEQTA